MTLEDRGAAAGAMQEGDATVAKGGRYALALLFVVYTVNLVDRQILAVLLEPIKQDLGLSDSSLGLLTGFAFAAFYATFGIPIAAWADRSSRRDVIALGLLVWSSATAACGAVQSYAQLFAARMLVGIGEAAGSPPAHSLISDYFPARLRATALALYSMGGNVGIGVGFFVGGLLGDAFGWRWTFALVGIPGIALAGLVRLSLREPPRGAIDGRSDRAPAPPLGTSLAHLARLHAYRHIAAATALYNLASYAYLAWVPTFLRRVHDLSGAEIGVLYGPMLAGVGVLGGLVAGSVSDWAARRDARWLTWVPALASLSALPFLVIFLWLENPRLAFAAYMPVGFLTGMWAGPTYAAVQGLAPLRMRATASALLLFALNFIGMGLGPLIVGMLNDALAPEHGEQAIRYSLSVVALAKLWGALHGWLASRELRAELAAAGA
jgi:predicted MFS family arabinose efflux permease